MAVVAGVAQCIAGVALWSVAEYLLHRADMHGRSGRGTTAREHIAHHASLDTPPLTAGTWVGAGIVAVALVVGGAPLVGVGWMAAYVGYELTHRRIHTGRPERRGRYGRWVRAHHLHHHLVDVRSNYGVTSPVWDVAFRTYRRPRPDVEARAEAHAQRRTAG